MVARHYVCPGPSYNPKAQQTHIVHRKMPCSNPTRCRGCGFGYYQEHYDYPCNNCFTGEFLQLRGPIFATGTTTRYLSNGWDDHYEQNILSYIEGLYGYLHLVLLSNVPNGRVQSVSTEFLRTFYSETQCRELAHRQRESLDWVCSCFSTQNGWRSNLAIGLRRYWAYAKYLVYQGLFAEDQLQAIKDSMSDEFADAPTDEDYQYQWETMPASLDQILGKRYQTALAMVRTFQLAPERAEYFGKLLSMSDQDIKASLQVRGDALTIVALTLAADSGVPENALRDIMRGFLPLLYPSGAFGNDLYDFRYDPLDIPGQDRAPRSLGPVETAEGWKLMNDVLEVYIDLHKREPGSQRRLKQIVISSRASIAHYHDILTQQDAVDLKTYRLVADHIEKHLEYVADSEACTKEVCGICRIQLIGGTTQDDHQEGIYPKIRSHRAVRWKGCYSGHAFGLSCFLRTVLWRSDGQLKFLDLPWLCPYCRKKAA